MPKKYDDHFVYVIYADFASDIVDRKSTTGECLYTRFWKLSAMEISKTKNRLKSIYICRVLYNCKLCSRSITDKRNFK